MWRETTRVIAGAALALASAAPAYSSPQEKPVICQSADERKKNPRVLEASDQELSTFASLLNAGVEMKADELLGVVKSARDSSLRLTAVLALGYCDLHETKADLETLLDVEPPGFVRDTLLTTLLRWRSPKARAIVARILEDPATALSTRLQWYPDYLRAGGDCDCAFVESVASSSDEGIRRRAVLIEESLLRRTEYSGLAIALLRGHLRDPSKSVRQAALSSLANVALEEPSSAVCSLVSEAKLLLVEPQEKERADAWMKNLERTGRCATPPGAP